MKVDIPEQTVANFLSPDPMLHAQAEGEIRFMFQAAALHEHDWEYHAVDPGIAIYLCECGSWMKVT